MKKIILILVCWFFTSISTYSLEFHPKDLHLLDLSKIRMGRFVKIPLYSYAEDSDLDVIGVYTIEIRKSVMVREILQEKIKEQIKRKDTPPTLNKVKYLDLVILNEENIS
jgi:hypothetical protein